MKPARVFVRRWYLWGPLVLLAVFLALPVVSFDAGYSTALLDKDQQLLAAVIAPDEQWRFPPAREAPEKFTIALQYFEDRRFRLHPGVDLLAVGRAVLQNITAGRVVSGASTITMQVVRLSRMGRPRSLAEKILESLLALRLELAASKDEILAMYAAHAPFGGNVVGLEAASWRYFGRQASSLSWAEAALLAVLPNNPGMLHLGRGRSVLRAKRDGLLRRMHAAEILDEGTLALALAEPLPHKPFPLPQQALHVLHEARWTHGQTGYIHSTLDGQLQSLVSQAVVRHHQRLAGNDIHNIGVLVLNTQTGDVLAYIGNTPRLTKQAHAPFVNVVTAPRSTGSILKPFLYAAMLEDGRLLPDQLVMDIPVRIGGFAPENFERTHDGAVPASHALVRSLNIPAVWMLRDYGVDVFHAFLRSAGASTMQKEAGHYGLSLVLGGAESSLWDLAGMYAGMGRAVSAKLGQPVFWEPRLIVDTPVRPHPRSLHPGAAYITLEKLLEVRRPGVELHWKQFSGGRKVAWKTGTSYGFRDAWAIGVTPEYTVGVWAGNASGEGRADLTGTKAAAPLLFELFAILPKTTWFNPPVDALERAEVCVHSGMKKGRHCPRGEMQQVPHVTARGATCEYCETIHCDAQCRYRINADCETISQIRSEPWFLLPPGMEWFYVRRNPAYKQAPPWRSDCAEEVAPPMSVVFPRPSGAVYIPVELSGGRGQVVFEVAHREPQTRIHWHLGDDYVGTTQHIHQLGLSPASGRHVLTLVDERGHLVERVFTVVDRAGIGAGAR